MNRAPHPSAILSAIAILFMLNLPGRRVGAADAPPARRLPAEIIAAQTTPDITVTGGFLQVAGIGDFNGDGVSDFLVKYERIIGDTGTSVFFKFGIIFGKRNPAQPVTINLITDEPDLALTTRLKPPFWYSEIAAPGDINGDGIDDMVISQVRPQQTDSPAEAQVKIFYGSTRWRPGTEDIDTLPADLTILPNLSVPFSLSVAGAADVNGDGVKDLLLAITSNFSRSIVFSAGLLLGPFAPGATFDLNTRPPDVLVHTDGAYVISPVLVADVNGDRVADVLIKRQRFDPRLGVAFTQVDIAFGSPAWRPGTEISFATQPPDASVAASIGSSVIQVGDVNGDGTADILAGLPWYAGEPAPPAWFTGNVNIYLGSPALRGSVTQPDVILAGLPAPLSLHPLYLTTLGDHLGEAIAIGDVNGDGLTDILVGAPGVTTNDNGKVVYLSRAHIIIGSAALKTGARIETASTQQDVTISFDAKAGGFGRRLESGDFNGDGFGDILVSNDGIAYVYFGGPLGAPEVTAARYKSKAAELTIFGADFNGAARIEINGMMIDQPVVFDAAENTLVLRGTPAQLNLRDGKNQVIVIRKGARSNAVKIKVK